MCIHWLRNAAAELCSHVHCVLTLQKIPMRELRASEKNDIVELAVTMQTGVCPYIVGFYGCLIRDVSLN